MKKRKKKTLDKTQFYFLIKKALQPLDYNERALASMLGYAIVTTLSKFYTKTGSQTQQTYEEIKAIRESFHTLIEKLEEGKGLIHESELEQNVIEFLKQPKVEFQSHFLKQLFPKLTNSNYSRRLEDLGLNLYSSAYQNNSPSYGIRGALELDINNLERSIEEVSR